MSCAEQNLNKSNDLNQVEMVRKNSTRGKLQMVLVPLLDFVCFHTKKKTQIRSTVRKKPSKQF